MWKVKKGELVGYFTGETAKEVREQVRADPFFSIVKGSIHLKKIKIKKSKRFFKKLLTNHKSCDII